MKIIDAHFHLFEPPVSQEDGQAQTTRRPEATGYSPAGAGWISSLA